ncbi:MAG: PD40 domain-containing protein [Bacteroidetes bacterium]|nr:PD40 domain-containing protein [Bacteroidota bacterium]
MNKTFLICSLLACNLVFSQQLWMRYPAISPAGDKIAFAYQGDIFVVDSKGGNALQITAHAAHDYRPVWNNDGTQIAFASNRFGNFDIFLVAADGGTPTRLTYHSAHDIPYEFTTDGKTVLYQSSRLDAASSVQFPYGGLGELYAVSTSGGREKQYLTVAAEEIQFSPDGKKILFQNKKGYEDTWRKHHTSSVTRDLVLYDTDSKKYTQLTDWKGEDRNPVWGQGDEIYFLSEKSGCFNVWKGTAANPYGTQLTSYTKHPVRFLSYASASNTLCFGYDGEIYTWSNGTTTKVPVTIRKDETQNATKYLKVGAVSEFALSPGGKEIAFIFRGEVFVTSIDYSTTKQITSTPEQERSVSFSPDGNKVLFAGERNESWNIYEVSRVNKDEKYFFNATLLKEKELVNNGEETFDPKYSPDGKEVAFLENRTTLKVLNLETMKERVVMPGSYNYSYSDGDQYFTWSPDSKWLLVQFFEFERWTSDAGLVNASGKEKPINLTQSGYANGAPKFAMNGEMVYYTTDKYGFRSHGSWGAQDDVEAVFLTEDAYQKFNLSKEEYELWKEEEKAAESKEEKTDDKKDTVKKTEPLKIETEGLDDRRVRLTIHSSSLADFVVTDEGDKLYYMTSFEEGYNIWTTDFREHETKMLANTNSSPSALIFNKEQDKLYYSNSGKLTELDVKSGTPKPLSFEAEMLHNAAAERTYMFNHAWRQLREKFYVEDLHGVDWEMYKKEYAKFLPYINNGYDFAEMLSELLGEINASHTGARYGETTPDADQTATFGCFYDESYTGKGLKILEIMDKSPLDTKSDKISAGVIIEKIDGVEITENMNYYPLLNRKVGEKVLVGFYNPQTKERWDEIIEPISAGEENHLAYERWVKRCEATVEQLSGGRLGYVHITGMNSESFRALFDKALGKLHKKEALIVDTRFNGGGWLHDDLATFLSGKLYMSFEPRGQKNMGGEPIWKWQKPSCVLMSEGNYSDAHLFPYTYKSLGIGKLIGMPVPGTGTAVWWERMIDGKTVFGIPQIGMRSVTEGFLVENHDLEPDIQVNNEYEKFISGEDQQLRAAVEELLK